MEDQEKNASFFRFEDLRLYAKASDYSSWLMRVLNEPQNKREEVFVQSFCRSAFDIALNIAEGSARNKTQFEYYLKIAKTAIRECVVFTTVASSMGLFDLDAYQKSRETLMELTRMVGALIISIQRSNGGRRRDSDDRDNYSTNYPSPIEDDDTLNQIDTNF
jgi:four helix bundle protein